MKKYVWFLAIACCTLEHAEASITESLQQQEFVEQAFAIKLTSEQKQHCNRFIMEFGRCYPATAAARSRYFKALGKRTRGVPATQFLAFAFEDSKRLRHMRWIAGSSIKWPGVRRSLIRGLKKEAEDSSLFEQLPAFANHCGKDADTLRFLAEEGKWEGFLTYLLKK